MRINLREKDNVVILDLEGNIDINSSDLVETVARTVETKTKYIVCNFEGINLVDYLGVSLIAVIYKNVLNHEGKMALYAVPSHVMNLFSIVGLNRVFDYYQTEEEALAAIKEEVRVSKILRKQLRRKFKRIPSNLKIEYKQKFSRKDLFYKGEIINLSAEGVFVSSPKVFVMGDLLFTRIDLSPKPGIVEVDAKVVWVSDEDIQPQDFPGMGLEFHNISTTKQKKIIEFVERHLTHSSMED